MLQLTTSWQLFKLKSAGDSPPRCALRNIEFATPSNDLLFLLVRAKRVYKLHVIPYCYMPHQRSRCCKKPHNHDYCNRVWSGYSTKCIRSRGFWTLRSKSSRPALDVSKGRLWILHCKLHWKPPNYQNYSWSPFQRQPEFQWWKEQIQKPSHCVFKCCRNCSVFNRKTSDFITLHDWNHFAQAVQQSESDGRLQEL